MRSVVSNLPRDIVADLAGDAEFARLGAPDHWPNDKVSLAVCRREGIPVLPLALESIDLRAFETYRSLCLPNRFLPTFQHNILLCIVTPEPFNQEILREIRRRTQKELRILGCTEQDFDRTYTAADAAVAESQARWAAANPPATVLPATFWPIDPGNLGKTVDAIIENAFRTGATDIQVEPKENQVDIRFLYSRWEPMPPIELQYRSYLIKAFKQKAGLSDLGGEAFMSGKISFTFGEGPGARRIDLRIEISPSVNGDGVSARILERDRFEGRNPPLPFAGDDLAAIHHCLAQAQGLVLIVGPTGSGKTTLLVKLLRHLDDVDLNIRTIEDPPEYTLPGIYQIEVGKNVNRTFEEGLRSLLRQKPNVIVVGEIRSEEVASTAVEAGLSGHLVFATLHSENAPSAVTRILELGVKPHTLQSVIHAIIGQRLVPVLCGNCKRPEPPSLKVAAHFQMYGLPVPSEVFKPVGCHRCSNRGTIGKLPIFEIFAPSREIRELIVPGVKDSELQNAWLATGGCTMVKYGLKQVAAGTVAWEDIRAYERERIDAPHNE